MTQALCLKWRHPQLQDCVNLTAAKIIDHLPRPLPAPLQDFPEPRLKVIQTVRCTMKTLALCLKLKRLLQLVANDHLAATIPFLQWDTRARMGLRDQYNLDIQWPSFTLLRLPCLMTIRVSCLKQIHLPLQVRKYAQYACQLYLPNQ